MSSFKNLFTGRSLRLRGDDIRIPIHRRDAEFAEVIKFLASATSAPPVRIFLTSPTFAPSRLCEIIFLLTPPIQNPKSQIQNLIERQREKEPAPFAHFAIEPYPVPPCISMNFFASASPRPVP